jgi:hypothetical protein
MGHVAHVMLETFKVVLFGPAQAEAVESRKTVAATIRCFMVMFLCW